MELVAGDLFLLGLLSLMDALLNMPLRKVIAGLPVDEEISNALFGKPSRFRALFEVVLHCEAGAWPQLAQAAKIAGVAESSIPDLYAAALAWADGILSEVLLPAAR
jgi:EAL and modified HD-GYP domain-containing signal transduction protein